MPEPKMPLAGAPEGRATATPWIMQSADHVTYGDKHNVERTGIWGGDRQQTPILDGYVLRSDDAALIVRAVNSYEDLVGALDDLMQCFAPDGLALTADEMRERYEAARAALAKARTP